MKFNIRRIWRVDEKLTYEDIFGVFGLDGSNNSGGNHELLPGLGEVEVVDSVSCTFVDVVLHLLGAVLGANVNLKPCMLKNQSSS